MAETSLRGKFISGAAWVTATRWAIRFIGLLNTVILARLLAPEDFGLIAIAMLVVDFIDVWMWLGVESVLVQKKQLTRRDYDSAWTLRVIQGALIAVLIAAAAPVAASFFKEPRVDVILWCLAPAIFLTSAGNIGIVDFQRNINFKAEFAMMLGSKLIGVAVTVIVAFWLRSYWALVVGIISGYVATFAISYLIHPYRPRLSLEHWREIWGFSKWIIVGNVGGFLNRKVDEVIVGRAFNASALGVYTVALDIGQMVTNELARPINKVLFPVIATIQNDLVRVRKTYLKTIEGINTVTLPAGIGLAMIANEFVLILLGDKWSAAIPYLQIFAIYGALRFTYSGAPSLLIALGRVKINSHLSWYEALFMLVSCGIGGAYFGLLGIAYGRFAVALLMAVVTLVYLKKFVNVGLMDFISVLWRPGVGVFFMVFAIFLLDQYLCLSVWLMLFMKIIIGALVYILFALLVWLLVGRPDGVESMIFNRFRRLWLND